MKKIGILLIAFLLLGSFAYAETFDVEFEGEASAAFGMDLETQVTGFTSSADAGLDLTFVPEQTLESDGDGWYGHIAIDFELLFEAEDGDLGEAVTASVDSARITDDVFYLQIFGVPDDASRAAGTLFDFEDGEESFLGDDGFSVLGQEAGSSFAAVALGFRTTDEDGDFLFEPGFRFGQEDVGLQGITIGYGEGIVNDISVGIVSDGDWTENERNAYAARLNADVSPIEIVDVVTTLYLGFPDADEDDQGNNIGSSTEISVEAVPGTTVSTGFDLMLSTDAPDEDGLAWVASLAVEQAIVEGSTVALKASVSPDEFPATEDSELDLDLGLLFREDTAEGFVPGVGAGIGLSMQNVLSDVNQTLGVLADIEYDEGGINPFVGAGYHMPLDNLTVNDSEFDVQFVAYEVGLRLTEDLHTINNTTFTARYGTWDSIGDGFDGSVIGDDAEAFAEVSDDFNELRAGYLTLETTVSF